MKENRSAQATASLNLDELFMVDLFMSYERELSLVKTRIECVFFLFNGLISISTFQLIFQRG